MLNQYSVNTVPIPSETALFSDDGIQDHKLKWRWWFKIPDIWLTSNIGEKIIGIRTIFLMKNRRTVKFTLCLTKYQYYIDSNNEKIIIENTQNNLVVNVVSWISVENDLRSLWNSLVYNVQDAIKQNELTKTNTQVSFQLDTHVANKRDIQMDGVFETYNNRISFVEKLYCPNNYETEQQSDGKIYYTECLFTLSEINRDFELIFNTAHNTIPNEYVKQLNFYDVWDRHSCKIFSNLASSSNKNYIGNTDVIYNPIKYFKFTSSDNKFYIDFYNARNINCPSIIPYIIDSDGNITLSEPFIIELQLLQNEKLLYI